MWREEKFARLIPLSRHSHRLEGHGRQLAATRDCACALKAIRKRAAAQGISEPQLWSEETNAESDSLPGSWAINRYSSACH
jgi:hypothetical protein